MTDETKYDIGNEIVIERDDNGLPLGMDKCPSTKGTRDPSLTLDGIRRAGYQVFSDLVTEEA